MLPIMQVAADPADPDTTPTFTQIHVNRGVLENSDFVLYALYDLPYAVLPTDAASINYAFQLISTDGVTLLGTASPYPYNDLGYNLGIISFYFDAAAAPVWGQNYILRMTQNPAKFSTPLSYSTAITPGAYTSLAGTDNEGNQLEMAERIKTMIVPLELEFGVTLLSEQDTGPALSSSGEAYFRNAITGLQSMAPSLFFTQIVSADTSTRTWGTSLGDTYQERLYGADTLPGTADDHWIYTAFAGVADWINIPYILLIGLVALGICVVLIWKSNQKWQTPWPGYVASLLIIMCAGILTMGFTLIALIALFLVLSGGWFLFMRKA